MFGNYHEDLAWFSLEQGSLTRDKHVLQTFRGHHCVWVDLFCCLLLLQRTKLGFGKRGSHLQGTSLILTCWGREADKGGL